MPLLLRSSTTVRSWARRLGLSSLLAPHYRWSEDKVRDAIRTAVRRGDTAWDVGANIGEYTALLSELVGPSGHVVAFEPSPASFARLQSLTKGTNVLTLPVALGACEGRGQLMLADDPISPSNSLLALVSQPKPNEVLDVSVCSGDALIAKGVASAPNVVKIDVEGFEGEVIAGHAQTLNQPSCRVVLVEVHFAILDATNRRQTPSTIVSTLKKFGLRVRWIDHSHLIAIRPRS